MILVRPWSAGVAALVCWLNLLGCSSGDPTDAARGPISTQCLHTGADRAQWIIQNNGVRQLREIPAVRTALQAGCVLNLRGEAKPYRDDNTAVAEKFTSYAQFEAAVENGAMDEGTQTVLYDPEAWSATPVDEQQAWDTFSAKFVELAHRHGLSAVVAPALDLVPVVDRNGRGPFPSRYLAQRIPALAAASGADAIVIQAQSLEDDRYEYADFVRSAADQAWKVNPEVAVFAGLSTGPTGIVATSEMLVAAVHEVGRHIDGYWVNTPSGPSMQCPRCTGGPVSIVGEVIPVVTSLLG